MRPTQWLIAPLIAACTWAGAARSQSLDDCDARPRVPVTLDHAEQRFERCNRDVRAAANALAAAIADQRIAAQRPNPTMTVGASNINPHVGIGPGGLRDKTFDKSLRFEQLVERGGKAEYRIAQADALARAAQADLREQLRTQRLAMRAAFFDLAAAQERVRLQRDFRAIGAQSADAARRRAAAGEISSAEANRFRLDAARVDNDLRQAETDLERARLEFAKTIGAEPFAAALEVAATWPAGEPRAATDGERPEVVAARLRFAAAQAARELARSVAKRDWTVGVQADQWPVSETNTQGTGVSYSIGVSIPLNVRHASEGEVQRAEADLEAARTQLVRAEAQSAADKRIAEQEWRSASERQRRFETEIGPAAREVAQGAEYAYSRGATGVLDLLDARRSLKAVELDEVQARADAAKAWARLDAARTVDPAAPQ